MLNKRIRVSRRVIKIRWFLFGCLLFFLIGGVSEFEGLGRIRIILAILMAFSFDPIKYIKYTKAILKRKPVFIAILFIAYRILSWCIWGENDSTIIRDYVTCVILMVWTSLMIQSPEDLVRFQKMIVIVISFIGITAITGLLFGNNQIGRATFASGTNPNTLANNLVLAIPFSITYWQFSNKLKEKIFGAVTLGILSVALLGTGSRSGLISVLALLGVVLIFNQRLGIGKVIKTILLIYGLIILLSFLVEKVDFLRAPFARISTLQEFSIKRPISIFNISSVGDRLPVQKQAVDAWWENPVFGVGETNFMGIGYSGKWVNSHNTFTEILAELGLVGIVLYILLLIALFKGFAPYRLEGFGAVPFAFVFLSFMDNCIAGAILLYVFAAVSGAANNIATSNRLSHSDCCR